MSLVPQVGMVELLMLAILALVVVGPKDLPRLANRVGKGMAQVRRMADDFRASFDQMAKEAEIDEMRREIEALKAANPAHEMEDAMRGLDDPLGTSAAASAPSTHTTPSTDEQKA